ncbi:hypothetical protein Tco_1073104 [Tanacetum coccineum]
MRPGVAVVLLPPCRLRLGRIRQAQFKDTQFQAQFKAFKALTLSVAFVLSFEMAKAMAKKGKTVVEKIKIRKGGGSQSITEDDVKGEAENLISYVKPGSGAVISKPSSAQFVFPVVPLEDGLALF